MSANRVYCVLSKMSGTLRSAKVCGNVAYDTLSEAKDAAVEWSSGNTGRVYHVMECRFVAYTQPPTRAKTQLEEVSNV